MDDLDANLLLTAVLLSPDFKPAGDPDGWDFVLGLLRLWVFPLGPTGTGFFRIILQGFINDDAELGRTALSSLGNDFAEIADGKTEATAGAGTK